MAKKVVECAFIYLKTEQQLSVFSNSLLSHYFSMNVLIYKNSKETELRDLPSCGQEKH